MPIVLPNSSKASVGVPGNPAPAGGAVVSASPPAQQPAPPAPIQSSLQQMQMTDVQRFHALKEALWKEAPNKDHVRFVITNILGDLSKHPEYEEFLAPEDMGMMLRLLRQNYAIKIEVKSKEKAKREAKKKDKSGGFDLSVLQDLKI